MEWNRTEREYPERCVHELFEEQVERKPEAVAVVYGKRVELWGVEPESEPDGALSVRREWGGDAGGDMHGAVAGDGVGCWGY